MNPIFNSVELSIYKTKFSYLTYIHELVHSQVDSVKYNIENYYNSEIASIFMELLNVHESPKQDTPLPLQDAIRMTELYDLL